MKHQLPAHRTILASCAGAAFAVLLCAAATAQTTATYNGPNTTTNGNTWMTVANWLPAGVGVPAGPVSVVIPAGKTAAAWDDATPVYSGNLTLGTNATLQMGWDHRIRPASFNALGIPGTTLITLAEGARINSRSGASFEMPEILLTGNARVILGSSTQVPSEGVFNYPINGPFEFALSTNANGGGAQLNAPNTFTSMVIQGSSGRGQNMFPFQANVPGALGLGNVTIIGSGDYVRTPQLQFNAPNVMAITGKLTLNGRGPSGNGNDRILMNQSATIGGLVVDGVEQAPGVYTNNQPWLAGPGTLTVLLISPHNPDPAFGKVVPFGDVNLTWTNEAPSSGADVWVDVWFGTDPNNLTQLATKQPNLASFTVNIPAIATTHYWRVDSYLDGSPDGTPQTGGLYHFVVADTTGDGIADAWKELYFTSDWQNNPTAAAAADPDKDGLTNLQEFLAGTIPTNPDTDADGLLDGWETNTGIWVSATDTGTDPLKPDTDGDGLRDGWETHTGVWVNATNTGTNPNQRDSDGDSLSDGVETGTGTFVSAANTGTDPNKPDTDGDGAGDWYEIFASITDPTDASDTPGVPYPLPAYDGSAGVSNKPVKVYILSGQSNMVGFGQIYGTAPGTLATITQRENKFSHLLAPGGGYVTRNDVHYRGVISALGKAPLRPGFGRDGSSIGPELGFGHLMGWYHDEPVLIIKASIGNRSLLWDILPVGSERFDWTDGRTYAGYGESPASWVTGTTPTPSSWYAGKEFDRFFLAKVDWAPAGESDNTIGTGYVLDNFAAEYPQWAAQGFEIAGFGWFQGFGDQGSPANNKYEENMVRKIKYLRSYYENRYPGKVVPNAPYAIATFAVGGFDNQSSGGAKVAEAQLNVDGDSGKYPEFAGNVKTMEARHYWRTRAQSPGAEDYHYYWNAETYMLAGDALARAIIAMQDDETPPTPNPMTFEVAPQGAGTGAIGMRATLANDQSMPVEYNFWNTTNDTFSGWSTSREWIQTGLINGETYSYRVNARDANEREGQWSPAFSATAGADSTPPSPSPMIFSVLPTALGETSITMTATTASDFTAVEYYFACTEGGGPDSGWQSGTVFTPTSLNHSTTYSYTVRARDAAENETAPSAPASATTASPDLTPPAILTLNPANGSTTTQPSANLVVTFNVPVQKGTGNIVIRLMNGDVFESISVGSAAVTVSSATITINPIADLAALTQYFIEIDAGAIHDLAGNAFPGISGSATWSFTTVAPPGATPQGMIYSDDFTSGTNGSLNGQSPQARPGSETWRAGSTNKNTANGGSVTGTAAMSAHLPMPAIEAEKVYTLTARAFNNFASSSTNWIAIGFTTQTANTSAWNVAGTGVYWMLWRGNDEIRGFRGPGATNPIGATSGFTAPGVGDVLDLRVIFDARTGFNTMSYQYKNPEATDWSTYASAALDASSIASIHSVGFSTLNGSSAGIQSFQLTVVGDSDPPVPPTLLSIEDDREGNPVDADTPVIYTLTFDRDMDLGSFGTDDFGNAGSSAIELGTFSRLAEGVFTVDVTPLTAGTLRFQINQGATLKDPDGLDLVTSTALLDDTVITVTEPPASGVSFDDWADRYPALTDRNPALDFDIGGRATALEWVLGGDPTDGGDDAALAPTFSDTTALDDKYRFVYRRSAEAHADPNTTMMVEYSTDLIPGSWLPAVHQGTGPDDITITELDDGFGEGIDRVSVALPASLGAHGRLFVRLSVTVAGE